jgi:outer membrane biosynthesis protein TonB
LPPPKPTAAAAAPPPAEPKPTEAPASEPPQAREEAAQTQATLPAAAPQSPVAAPGSAAVARAQVDAPIVEKAEQQAQPPNPAPPAAKSEETAAPKVPAHLASLPAKNAAETDNEERGRLTGTDIGLVYPRKAKRLDMKGTLFVRLIVADDGGVLDVEVIDAEPPGLKAVYEDAIEKAMMKLRYPPRGDNWPAEYDLEVDPPAEN